MSLWCYRQWRKGASGVTVLGGSTQHAANPLSTATSKGKAEKRTARSPSPLTKATKRSQHKIPGV